MGWTVGVAATGFGFVASAGDGTRANALSVGNPTMPPAATAETWNVYEESTSSGWMISVVASLSAVGVA